MTVKYYALLTNLGAAKLANAAALGTKLQITQMAVGDGGGLLPTPNASQTALIGEKRRAPLNQLSIDTANSSQIIAEQIIPETDGGFWIREIGLFDTDGLLIAVANCAETYKPQLQEGSGRTQTVRLIIIVSSTDAVTLKIDPSVVLATRKYVDDAVIEVKTWADKLMSNHVAAANPHDQYLKIASALSEIKDAGLVADVLKNLGLGEAAKLNTGTSKGNVAKIGESAVVISTGSNANGYWRIWSDGCYELWGSVTSISATTGRSNITFPVALPAKSRFIYITQLSSTYATYVPATIIADGTISMTGFSAVTLRADDLTYSTSGYVWRVIYQP